MRLFGADFAAADLVALFALLLLGAAVNYLKPAGQRRSDQRLGLVGFFGEAVTTVFIGLVSFLLLYDAEKNLALTAGVCALAGHFGTRILFMLRHRMKDIEAYAEAFFKGRP